MIDDTIFFSYSREDSQFAIDLAKCLRDVGVALWLDKIDIKIGSNWNNSAESALQSCNTVIIILSKKLLRSQNVLDEYSYARQEGKKIVLILLEECDLPMRFSHKPYADFSKNSELGMKTLAEMLQLNNNTIKKLNVTCKKYNALLKDDGGNKSKSDAKVSTKKPIGSISPNNISEKRGITSKSSGSIIPKGGGSIVPQESSSIWPNESTENSDIIPTQKSKSTSPKPSTSGNKINEEKHFEDYESSNKTKVLKLFFGTDRNVIKNADNEDISFGCDNSDLTFGICNVSIPSKHKVGEIERPWMNIKFLEKESKHITFKSLKIEEKHSFISKLNKDLNSSPTKSALIFIHGFNVSFVNAAMRTAQISYDLKFEGIRSFYSWPSQGRTASYSRDEEAIQISESKLRQYFREVVLNSKAENIYIIGHSMGTRVLSKVMGDLFQENPIFKKKIREIILTAPDINARIFEDELVPKFRSQQKTITLYASTQDLALKASRKIHKFSRAGESGNHIVITKGVETIDATGMDTGFLKHSYFGESKSVINDIYNLIAYGKRPDKRRDLSKEKSKNGEYWKFKK